MSDARFGILITVLLAVISGIGGLFVYILKGISRWSKTEQQLTDLMDQVQKLVKDKDTVHREIMQTIREDRAANNQRLRWLEENLWKGRNRAV